MNLFGKWHRRHIAADPMEPASPPPFKPGDRVVVSAAGLDGILLDGRHGAVVDVEFTTDLEDVWGPWIIFVLLDDDPKRMRFNSSELAREQDEVPPGGRVEIVVTQHEEDYEPYTGDDLDRPVPYAPTDGTVPESLQPWIQRANELRHETVFTDTPVYDDVVASAMSADGLAAEVSAYLADVAGGAA